jgi:signal transduction histidine kinase/ActR/RegA family two-component response regulator
LIKAKNNVQPVSELLQSNANDVILWNLAPHTDWSKMGQTEHFAQFYEADSFLINSLSSFAAEGLRSGDAVIVVATKQHREDLEQLLKSNELDLVAAGASGQYVSLDATDLLSRFMVEGALDPARFNELLSGIFAQAADGGRRVRIFGEMVAVLWAEGKCDAAIHLEELWNHLQQGHPFSLFCAYPLNGFGGEALAKPLSDVCSTHSRVIPAESYIGLTSDDERLRAILDLQQKARTLEAEINERKRAEERLRLALVGEQMARAEAETANRMKDEFLATVSHELRTPLNAIIGWSHLLRSGSLDGPTIARAMDTIDRNAKSQAQLIEDILDVSRMITGKLRLSHEAVDLVSVINSAIDSVQLASDSKDIQLKVTLDPSARHTVGDSSRLQQVVWNLLANAIKFTPSGGRIEVKVEQAGRDAQIRVSDTGQGISPAFLPFIFDRFRQADGTTTREHSGLGLGLAIVRNLVELHGGTIKAESKGEGQGATFIITLPLALNTERMNRHTKATGISTKNSNGDFSPMPALDNVRVLLIDNDRDTLQILSVMLEESRAIVQTAVSVSEAMEILEWYQPHVLVSDLAMPGEDGYSLIGKIRGLEAKMAKQTPAVALTSYVRVEDRTRALTAGFNMFVPKPVQPNELLAAIAHLAETDESV